MKKISFYGALSALFFVLSIPSAICFSQNVGIGTNNPAFKLDVKNGSINTDSVYRIGGKRVLATNLQNTFVGIGIANLATGDYNTAVGNEALYSNTTGERNTALGLWALYSNTSGYYNTGVGKSALHVNSTGDANTAHGYEALYYNNASFNTAVGYHALLFNTNGTQNTAIGYEALNRNSTGFFNTAIGSQSLLFNTTGSQNSATGTKALYSNSLGHYNTANGYGALYGNTQGTYNTAHGYQALYSNAFGDYNTACGTETLYSNTADRNTALGFNTLHSNTIGFQNTGVGYYTLINNITGDNNTIIGSFSDVSSGDLSNATALGYSTQVDASNKVRIGNTSVTSIGGQVGWSNFSDGRYKQNIQEDVPGILFINKLRPVTYTVDSKGLDENYYKLTPGIACSTNNPYRHTGFIAQEVERSATELGFTFSGVDKPRQPDGLYGLRYAEFVVPLVKAVQEQQQQINHLQVEIELLKEQNKLLIQLLNKKNTK